VTRAATTAARRAHHDTRPVVAPAGLQTAAAVFRQAGRGWFLWFAASFGEPDAPGEYYFYRPRLELVVPGRLSSLSIPYQRLRQSNQLKRSIVDFHTVQQENGSNTLYTYSPRLELVVPGRLSSLSIPYQRLRQSNQLKRSIVDFHTVQQENGSNTLYTYSIR
jgi:hypothetical protein